MLPSRFICKQPISKSNASSLIKSHTLLSHFSPFWQQKSLPNSSMQPLDSLPLEDELGLGERCQEEEEENGWEIVDRQEWWRSSFDNVIWTFPRQRWERLITAHRTKPPWYHTELVAKSGPPPPHISLPHSGHASSSQDDFGADALLLRVGGSEGRDGRVMTVRGCCRVPHRRQPPATTTTGRPPHSIPG